MVTGKILELKAEDSVANKDAIDVLTTELDAIIDAINNKPDPVVAVKPEGTHGTNASDLGKDMRQALERVPELTPGGDTSNFLAAIGNVHKNYVGDHPTLEERFVKYAVTRLSSAYQTQIHSLTTKITDWPTLQKHVRENYGLRLTPFQKLDELYDLKRDSNWNTYAVNLQNRADEVLVFLEDNWKKNHAGAQDRPFNTKALFDLMVTEIFLRNLQESPDFDCYNYICGSLHEVVDLNGAVAKAKGWLHRAKRNTDLDPAVDQTFFGNKKSHGRPGQPKKDQKSKKSDTNVQSTTSKPSGDKAQTLNFRQVQKISPGTCFSWVNGKCTRDNCKYKHEWCLDGNTGSTKNKDEETHNTFLTQGFHQ